jgi:hypothetical protein
MVKASPASKTPIWQATCKLLYSWQLNREAGRLPKSGQPKIGQHFLHLTRKFFTW